MKSLSHPAIFIPIICCYSTELYVEFTTILVGFIENSKYQVLSFSSLWENSFISSSLCKTNLPVTAIILNRKRRNQLYSTLENARIMTSLNDTRMPDKVAMESTSCLVPTEQRRCYRTMTYHISFRFTPYLTWTSV